MTKAVWTAVVVALAAVAVAVFVAARHGDVSDVADLTRGDCVDAAPLLRGEQPELGDLTRADCDEPHDAEVLMVVDLTAAQARAYRPVVPDTVCADALAGDSDVDDRNLLLAGLTVDSPTAGDPLVCLAAAADGQRIDGRLFVR